MTENETKEKIATPKVHAKLTRDEVMHRNLLENQLQVHNLKLLEARCVADALLTRKDKLDVDLLVKYKLDLKKQWKVTQTGEIIEA